MTDDKGRAVAAFVRFWDTVTGKVEKQENAQQDVIEDLAEVQAEQAAQLAAINALLGIVTATNQAAQAAQQAANDAQATADDALGGGTVSGFVDNPTVSVPEGFGWVSAGTVSLTGVVAGNLTIAGTGPLQDGDVEITSGSPSGYKSFLGSFRVVEIVGGVDTVLFTGAMSAYQGGVVIPATVSNDSSASVSAFTSARSSTGSVDYRIDFQSISGDLADLRGYLFVRRAA